MELTEKERLMLIEKKQELQKLTNEAIEIVNGKRTNDKEVQLKKCLTNILSVISTIGSYTDSKNMNLDASIDMVNAVLMSFYGQGIGWDIIKPMVELFCNYTNSIQLNFTKRTFKIEMPKIDLSLFKISHSVFG